MAAIIRLECDSSAVSHCTILMYAPLCCSCFHSDCASFATLPLREAVSTLLADCHKYASIRLGITSPDTQLAVDALGTWVDALGLPRGLLYGADDEGQPLDLTGGAYLKYTSRRSRVDEHSAPAAPGSARLHPYSGDFAGVTLAVGAGEQFRQYAALPLGLFCDDVDARAAPLTPLPPPEP